MRILDFWLKISLPFLLVASQVFSFSPATSNFRPRSASFFPTSASAAPSSPLYSTPKKQNLSASSQARREEDERRLQRKDDVVIGKTSAKQDAADFAMNTKSTEEEWLRQATRVEQQIFKLTEEGMEALKMLNLEDASEAFDEVFRLKPDAYLWQAGIVKFYMDDFETAANLFAKSAVLYESKFGGRASEERIWRHACELKLARTQKTRKRSRVTKEDLERVKATLFPVPDMEEDPDSLFAETRKVVRIATDLFEASVNSEMAGVILARAKLRAIGGNFDEKPRIDVKQRKLQSWFFLGLHYDALGEIDEAKEAMKMAFRNSPNSGNADNILLILPLLHMCERDWFDDDDMDANPLEILQLSPPKKSKSNNKANDSETAAIIKKVDPLVSDSIRKSIAKMKLPELQNALLSRGVKSSGSKPELQERLFQSLMSDAGLAT